MIVDIISIQSIDVLFKYIIGYDMHKPQTLPQTPVTLPVITRLTSES